MDLARQVNDDPLPPALRRKPLAARVYFLSKGLFKLTGRPPRAMLCALSVQGRPVLLSHAPKAGGTSLRRLLGTQGMTHAMPAMVLTEAAWRRSFVIAPVRHPFDRFVSGYGYHVRGRYRGTLFRSHGEALKRLSPFEYLAFITQYPEKLGPLTNWVRYPSAAKPQADLVLRIEESAGWVGQLRAAGLDLGERRLERLNASRAETASPEEVLGLPAEECARLRGLVHAAYAMDYEAFGYAP